MVIVAGGLECWRSRKKSIVATSSREADYIACCCNTEEAVWLSRLIGDVCNHDKPKPIRVFADIQGSIRSEKNQAITQRNKHVEIQYHYVRDVVALWQSRVRALSNKIYCCRQVTKPLDLVKFENIAKAMCVKPRNCPVPSMKGEC